MKTIIILLTFIVFATSCMNDVPKNNTVNKNLSKNRIQVNNHLNIIITPDLSNRISVYTQHKAVHDTLLIKALLDNYYPTIYRSNGRAIGQKDEISFLFTNPTIISDEQIDMDKLNIDFSDFNDGQRISYLVSRSSDVSLYELDKQAADNEIQRIYNNLSKNSAGADILNFFKSQLKNSYLKKDALPILYDQTTVYNKQRNILILFTDGYIEAGMYSHEDCKGNKYPFLDKNSIDQFRNAFKKSGSNNLEKFFIDNNYGIIPIENEQLQNLEVIVVEMYDRSLSNSGNQTQIPNDLEIMNLFWSDWLEESGVKKFKLLGTVNSDDEFIENIISFIEEGKHQKVKSI